MYITANPWISDKDKDKKKRKKEDYDDEIPKKKKKKGQQRYNVYMIYDVKVLNKGRLIWM